MDVETFLAHHGIKGMKWGIRRDRTSGGTSGGGNAGGGTSSDSSSSSSSNGGHGGGGTAAAEVHMSADAERFVKTHQKAGVEMSTREIQEAVQRANMVKQYNDIFNPAPTTALRQKVESMKLQKEYAQLHAEMNPTKLQALAQKAASLGKGYSAYAKLNEATGGELNNAIAQGLGLKPTHTPAHRAQTPSFGKKSKKKQKTP